MVARFTLIAALVGAALVMQGCPFFILDTEIQGTWVGATWVQGDPLFDDASYSEVFTFTRERFTVIVQNPGQAPGTITGSYTVDEVDKTIDMHIESSPDGSTGTSPGVYALEGGNLLLSFGGVGGERPSHNLLDVNVGPVFIGEPAAVAKGNAAGANGGGLVF